jgi:hypothetical protein
MRALTYCLILSPHRMKKIAALIAAIVSLMPTSGYGQDESKIVDCFPSPRGDVTFVVFSYGNTGERGSKFLKLVSLKAKKSISSLSYKDVEEGPGENVNQNLSYPEAHWSADGEYLALSGICLPREYKFFIFRYHNKKLRQLKIPEFPNDKRYHIAEDQPLNHLTATEIDQLRSKLHSESTSPLMWKDHRLFVKASTWESFYSLEGN